MPRLLTESLQQWYIVEIHAEKREEHFYSDLRKYIVKCIDKIIS